MSSIPKLSKYSRKATSSPSSFSTSTVLSSGASLPFSEGFEVLGKVGRPCSITCT